MLELLLQLTLTFAKIGAFSIGGGYAMIPLIQDEAVGMGWLSVQEVADLVALSQITPGPIAINAATFAGTKVAGLPGGIAATVGVVLPSVLITLAVSRFFFGFQKNKNVQAVLSGIRPAALGLILSACAVIACTSFFGMGSTVNFTTLFASLGNVNLTYVAIFAVALIAMRRYKVQPVLVLFISAGVGVALHALGV